MNNTELHSLFEKATFPIVGYLVDCTDVVEIKIVDYGFQNQNSVSKSISCIDQRRKLHTRPSFRMDVDSIILDREEANSIAKLERFYVETNEHRQQVNSIMKEKIEQLHTAVQDPSVAQEILSKAIETMS